MSRLSQQKSDALSQTILFIAFASLYLITSPRGIALEDDAIFVLASHYLGTAHPPGYPLFVLLGKLFSTLIPIGELAWRVHAVSAISAALAVVVTARIALQLTNDRWIALITAATLGVSQVFWSQAIIAEAYTLNLLLFLIALSLAISIHKTPQQPKQRLRWLAIVFGLSLANHWPLSGLMLPVLVILLTPTLVHLPKHTLLLALLSLLTATPFYLWMWWRTHSDTPINFYGPLHGWQDLWFFISRQGFSGADTSATATIADHTSLLNYLGQLSLQQFSIAGVLIAAIGLYHLYKYGQHSLLLALLYGIFGLPLLLLTATHFDNTHLGRETLRVYPIPAFAMLTLALAVGFSSLKQHIVKLVPPPVTLALFAILPVSLLISNWPINHRADDNFGTRYSHTLLDSLPKNAVLYAQSSLTLGPLAYAKYAENLRPDVTLRVPNGTFLSNRMISPAHTVPIPVREKLLRDYVNAETRPVFFAENPPKYVPSQRHLLTYEVVKMEQLKQATKIADIALNPQQQAFYDWLQTYSALDGWERAAHNIIAARRAWMLVQNIAQNPSAAAQLNKAFTITRQQFRGLAEEINARISLLGTKDHATITPLIKQAETRWDEADKDIASGLLRVLGDYSVNLGQTDKASQYYQRSIKTFPYNDNPAISRLVILLESTGKAVAAQRLLNHFPPTSKTTKP